MERIQIVINHIEQMQVDAVVNAANSGLWEGGGVCGAIFDAAGSRKLQAACNKIGHCPTGKAVITPGFNLPAKYIIHAVGPDFQTRGTSEEKKERKLYECYQESLKLAEDNQCKSIAFPLISSGIFGCPKEKAWEIALKACRNYVEDHDGPEIIYFTVLDDKALNLGMSVYHELFADETVTDYLSPVDIVKFVVISASGYGPAEYAYEEKLEICKNKISYEYKPFLKEKQTISWTITSEPNGFEQYFDMLFDGFPMHEAEEWIIDAGDFKIEEFHKDGTVRSYSCSASRMPLYFTNKIETIFSNLSLKPMFLRAPSDESVPSVASKNNNEAGFSQLFAKQAFRKQLLPDD